MKRMEEGPQLFGGSSCNFRNPVIPVQSNVLFDGTGILPAGRYKNIQSGFAVDYFVKTLGSIPIKS
jgi:hypothetical protein